MKPCKRGWISWDNFKPGNNRGPFADPEARIHYFYGHYYAAQAMWIAGGDHWKSWFPAIRDDLVTHSNFRKADGSWARFHLLPALLHGHGLDHPANSQ